MSDSESEIEIETPNAPSSSQPRPGRKHRHKERSIEDKLKLLSKFRNEYNGSKRAFIKNESIDKKTLLAWLTNEGEFLETKNKRSTTRLKGGGAKPKWPELEAELKEWVTERRKNKLSASWRLTRLHALEIAKRMQAVDFTGCDNWLHRFKSRSGLSVRTRTHAAQQDNKDPVEKARIAHYHLSKVVETTKGIANSELINMDEVPCQVDMSSQTTLDFIGAKSVDIADTGHSKTRFTTVLTVDRDGGTFKAMLIFKRKTVPKVELPLNVVVSAAAGGSMNEEMMHFWIEKVFMSRGPFRNAKRKVLVMDKHGAHMHRSVKEKLISTNTRIVYLPAGTTSYTQPLDVAINKAFKAAMREQWDRWMGDLSKVRFTKGGYRQRPSYQEIVGFVSNAVKALNRQGFARAFECCGIGASGAVVPKEALNERLQGVLSHYVDINDAMFDEDESELEEADGDDEAELVAKEDGAESDSSYDEEL